MNGIDPLPAAKITGYDIKTVRRHYAKFMEHVEKIADKDLAEHFKANRTRAIYFYDLRLDRLLSEEDQLELTISKIKLNNNNLKKYSLLMKRLEQVKQMVLDVFDLKEKVSNALSFSEIIYVEGTKEND
ncbi:hypothetical protein [Nitrosopumilus sp. Nsub]|uniref:hypothetical protein n=1 Tax=Nitrosopumilus sp. Nsub TaxID=1776294 RepID=UPI0012E3CB5E|nr:hypothetical protein [Nitrosopumilus sp. Nsub]